MISVQLIGGLGNQLFQIATTIAYATRHNLPWHIPVTASNVHGAQPYFTNLVNDNWDESLPTDYYDEPVFGYTEIPASIYKPGTNLVLRGYFQSYKYFEDFEITIHHIFSTILPLVYGKRDKIEKVAIHVRRGDYLQYPDKHPVVTADYICNAIGYYKEKGIENFSFFSDDMEWCKNFVSINSDKILLDTKINIVWATTGPLRDLATIANYDHFIISNSTYGWWGAWLSSSYNATYNNIDKMVVYPDIWFGPAYSDKITKDICPPSWIKM